MRLTKKQKIEILLKAKEILEENKAANDSKVLGLCDILHELIHKIRNIDVKEVFPEFTEEYCLKICPSTTRSWSYWWAIDMINPFDNSQYMYEDYYDYDSRIKVLDHFIELYSKKYLRKKKV